jgi:hypothetical protein
MNKIIPLFILSMLLIISKGFSQSTPTEAPVSYPKPVGYFSFILPIVVINKNETTNDFSNFKNGFAIGFPVGINVLYGDRFGVSYEFTPTVKNINGNSKVSTLLFDPGAMFRFKHRFTIIARLAFETSGRYGVTPVFNKIIERTKYGNYFIAASIPARVGNSEAPSIGGSLQFGLIFN